MEEIAKILLPVPFDKEFDYLIPEILKIKKGEYVQVPFGKRNLWGIVRKIAKSGDSSFKGKLKYINTTAQNEGFEIPNFSDDLFKLIDWQAKYTMEPRGKILSLFFSQKFFKKFKRKSTLKNDKSINCKKNIKKLNPSQQEIYLKIKNNIFESNSFSHQIKPILIDGVTGSGKTEIYFNLIEDFSNLEKQCLILLPEIILTSQMIERFEAHFGFTPVIWHSHRTEARKKADFHSICNGDAKVIMGARSALHLPYKNLGLIVLDEEHDANYKQEDNIIYNARDIAVIRANISNIPLILCSATPSIESYFNAKIGKYNHYKLSKRFNENKMPEINIIDMRQEKLGSQTFLSETLKSGIRSTLEEGKQSLLFLNRKGYAPLLLCGSCGFRFKSPDTSSWMVLHYDNLKNPYLECHHTGYKMRLPDKCPKCENKESFRACGPGVQRIFEEVSKTFPEARVVEVSKDTIINEKKSNELIQNIIDKKIDIIIGTQIISKGYHFPALKMVGVIDGDLGLDFSDLRASEKTFQLLQQVSGRAGREGERGKVFIQTYQAENKIFEYLQNDNRDEFLDYELNERKESLLPPFSRLSAIIIESKTEAKSSQVAKELTALLQSDNEVDIFGPAQALYYELRGYYRNRILMKSAKNINIQKYISACLSDFRAPNGVRVKIDIDPYNFS